MKKFLEMILPKEALNKLSEYIKKVGFAPFIEMAMKSQQFRQLLKKKFEELWNDLRVKYEIEDYDYLIEEVDGGKCKLEITLLMSDEGKKDEFVERSKNALQKTLKYELSQSFVQKYQIDDIKCYKTDEGVCVEVVGNREFCRLLESLLGGVKYGGGKEGEIGESESEEVGGEGEGGEEGV